MAKYLSCTIFDFKLAFLGLKNAVFLMSQPVKKFGLQERHSWERRLVRLWSDRLTGISRQSRMFSGGSQS
jgi:hypothetical protein